MQRKTYTIDAQNKSLGRIAVEAARILRGKHKPDFEPSQDKGDFVLVKNIKKIKLTGRKFEKKVYQHHTGFPGGLKKKAVAEVFQQSPGTVLRKAVFGMLPKNKLRQIMIKRLKTN